MLLSLVATEAVGEGETDDSAEVHVIDDVLSLIGIVQIVVSSLEDVVAIGFHLELVALERFPSEGGVQITCSRRLSEFLEYIFEVFIKP